MPLTVPAAPKVRTTRYENFKGVDFTNDATNVWYRRSPSAVNMLPDSSGRPFKRHGWSVLLSNADICTALGVDSCEIAKCSYFELAGVDHIVIFTNEGVVFYNGDENVSTNGIVGVTDTETDQDCMEGYDRSFFFEGDGTSAFYIYGNYKVWRYETDFQLHDVTSQVTVPTLLISADAKCVGTSYDGYNLLGTMASVEYNDANLFHWWGTDGLSFSVADSFKTGKTQGSPAHYRWKYSGGSWSGIAGTTLAFPSSDITLYSQPQNNDEIIIVYCYGVMLPSNVAQGQVAGVKVYSSASTQFDTPITVNDSSVTPIPNGECRLISAPINIERKQAFIEFGNSGVPLTQIVGGEDFIRVEFPSAESTTTTYTDVVSTTTSATLQGV